MNLLRCILFLSLTGFFAASAEAATITGTITDAHSGQPVAGLRLFVSDSAGNYFNTTVLTNGAGQYTATIPVSVPIYMPVTVSTPACGAIVRVTFPYNGGNITGASFSVCAGASLYTLQGLVSLGGIQNGGDIRLYLLQRAYSATLMDTVWTTIDSITTSSTYGYFSKSYSYGQIAAGPMLLKAALVVGHPEYKHFIPSYYTSAITWSNADTFKSAALITDTFRITMERVFDTSGLGSIGGAVISGAGKNNGTGDPLPGRILLLTNSANVAIRYTYSDAAGRYRFDSLALGTYKIFGDAPGKSNPALTVTITTSKPSLPDILFTETNKTFIARIGGVGVSSSLSGLPADVVPYPNPALDKLSFSGLDGIGGEKLLMLTDMRGVVLARQSFGAGQAVEIPVAALPAGMYLLRLETERGVGCYRVVRQ